MLQLVAVYHEQAAATRSELREIGREFPGAKIKQERMEAWAIETLIKWEEWAVTKATRDRERSAANTKV